jgi:hypothetical protein
VRPSARVETSGFARRREDHGITAAIVVRWIEPWPERVDIMSVIGDLRVSLDAIGYEQQACLFAFISSYPLAIGRLLGARGRRLAGGAAAAAMVGFICATTPWINGVLLVVFFVGGVGIFIASVCALDRLPRLVLRSRIAPMPVQAELPLFSVPEAPRERDVRPHPRPVRGHANSA